MPSAKIITDVNIKLIPKQYIRIKLRILRIKINSETINPHENYRRYRYYRFSYGRGAHIQAFTFLLTKTLSRSRSVVWCVWSVGCVCTCGVVCGVGGVWVVLLWWCVCVVCGEAWHTLNLFISLLPLLFPFRFPFLFSLIFIFLSSFSFSFSLAPSLTRALALVLSLFLLSVFSSRHQKHYGKNRSTNTAVNIEAFECDLAQGKCTAVPSVLPSLPPLLKRGNFLLQEYFRRGTYFTVQFKINSEKSPPGEITVITVLY